MTFSSIQWTRAALVAVACATILAVPVTTRGDKPFPKPKEDVAYPNEDIFAIERLCAPPRHFFWEGVTQPGAPLPGLNGHVWDIVGTDETSPLGRALYACGDFTVAENTILVNHVARWSGSVWSSLPGPSGVGLNGTCHTLAVGPDGLLYAGGAFTTAGGVSALRVAKWDGSDWSRLGVTAEHGVGGGVVYDLLFYNDGNVTPGFSDYSDGSLLLIGGSFTTLEGPNKSIPNRALTAFNGSHHLVEFPTYIDGDSTLGKLIVSKMIEYNDGRGRALYIAGDFERLGGVTVHNIGRWTSNNIEPLTLGIGDSNSTEPGARTFGLVNDMTVSGFHLYVAGYFNHAGGIPVDSVAVWKRTNVGGFWVRAGGPADHPIVEGVAEANLGAGSAVYLLGFFTEIESGGQIRQASHIAAGTPLGTWEDIGGLWPERAPPNPQFPPPEETPHGMVATAWDDGESNCLYVGGRFDKAGNVDALNIARYCCESWAIREGLEEAFEIGGALALEEFTFRDDGDGLPESIECAGDEVLLQPGLETEACGFHIVVGTKGDDQIDLSDSPLPALVFGGPGDDELMGSAYDDLVFGANGDDILHGGPGGGDMVWGGRGDDILEGGDGLDSMLGGPGDDALCGGEGHDIVDAGSGRDTVCAGSEEDEVRGDPDVAAPSVCGDGITEGTEVCDDGVNDGGEGECLPGCAKLQFCGDGFDGVPEGTEVCDDAVNEGGEGRCVAGCQSIQFCGDAVTEGTEECDDRVNDGTGPLGCLAGCLSPP